MPRRAATIITPLGAALVARTTLGLSLLDRGDWPVGLIGLGVLLALGASGLLAADRPSQPLGPSPSPQSRRLPIASSRPCWAGRRGRAQGRARRLPACHPRARCRPAPAGSGVLVTRGWGTGGQSCGRPEGTSDSSCWLPSGQAM